MDDADRYGPAVPLIKEVHRKIEEYLTERVPTPV